ncbi:CrcB family protein [Microbacterium foliorum]|uniref:Fluoride-specific ion channel FluC n=1 Tax=Microbacterium foliorum TaxID=104336 RepID=A0A4Y5YM56_9MICO|nr:CrcB family protein [Microbacterium foliorum]QDE33688.1 CrcB family protein [Microbacterium foliorum]
MTLRSLLLVFAGGSIGTAARLGVALWIPDAGGLPVATLLVNVIGALLIGILAARLPQATGQTTGLRVFLGTGVLGGFTTYSAFMTGTDALWADAPLLAFSYAGGSLVLGLAAAALGLRLGRPRPRAHVEGARS